MLLPRATTGSGWRFPCAQLALAAGLVACSDSGGTDPPPDQVAAVLVAPEVATLAVGATVQLSAAAVNAAGDTLDGRSIAWTTSAGAVSVSASGLVTALSAGTATVTATSEGKVGSASLIVEVSPDPVAAVLVAPAVATLAVGATVQLSAAAVNAAGDTLIGRSIAWASTTGAVTVSATGLVRALSAGTATVTATSEGKAGSAVITVEVSPDPVAAVLVAPTAATLAVGGTLQLSAAAVNAAGDTLIGRVIVWATTTGAVSVSSTGLVRALSAGTATVTATSEGKVGSVSITVGGQPPINVGGTWYLVEQLTDAAMQITCHDTATVTLNQTGSTFTGSSVQTGVCDTPSGPVDNAATLSVTSGVVTGTSITFDEPSFPSCHYQGTLDGNPATAATGTLTCVESPYNFSGTWAMSRTPP